MRPHLGLVLGGLIALLAGAHAGAAPLDAQQRYRQERAACLGGSSPQAREPCLREAIAALAEARRGRLDGGEAPATLAANALKRCAVVPADDRDACERLARGEGQVSGSVGQGGLLKQIVTRSIAETPTTTPARTP